jgi:sirohydrochlorin ferrochelatase
VTAPALLLAAHGSVDPSAAAVAFEVADAVRRRLPCTDVQAAFLGHATPSVSGELERLAATGPVVVVPFLLAPGHHTAVDLAGLVADARLGTVTAPVLTRPLGPDPRIATALVDRLAAAGLAVGRPETHVVVTGAAERTALATAADLLAVAGRWTTTAAPVDEVDGAVRAARTGGASFVGVAPLLLAPGAFSNRVTENADAADVVAPPIGAHSEIVRLVVERYVEAADSACVIVDEPAVAGAV